jgi:hypothetical protein
MIKEPCGLPCRGKKLGLGNDIIEVKVMDSFSRYFDVL